MTNTYDRLGRLIQLSTLNSQLASTYNLANELTSETQNGITVTNRYDAYLRRTNLVVQQSSNPLIQQSFTFDAASRLSTVSTLDSGLGTLDSATYSYLANSPLVNQITFKQNGNTRMTTSKYYDNLNRLRIISSAFTGNGVSYSYQYNDANQRTKTRSPTARTGFTATIHLDK